jgi:uncharacterized protein YndB with AHSA1/START domain
MAITFEHTIDVGRPPERTFAVLDDFALLPKWLARCTNLERVGASGPNAVGQKLKYAYKDAGRTGVMDGEIAARVPNERLMLKFTDTMMHVTVDFRVAKGASGTRLTHSVEITPQTFFGKVLSPLIRKQLPKQTITAMETLKALLEGGP